VTERETLRLAPPVVFWWVWLAFVAANVLDYAVQGLPSARFGAVVGAVLLLVTGLAFTLALRPKVIASGDGITVVNPYRTHFVPWRLVTFVDTGEWVQVHYAPSGPGDAVAEGAGAAGAEGGGDSAAGPGAVRTRGFAAASTTASSASSKTVHCWALYVSTRARRKMASGPPRPRAQRGLLGLGRGLAWGAGAGGAGATPSSRLPEEARYLASLPPAKAMAVRLDTRADRERARPGNSDDPLQATATWAWPALAAVVVPALVLLGVALA
jgi:PH (Pleckstrin Homology) domain-containing protein